MKKKSFIIPLLVALSLVFPQNISPLLAAPNPAVVTDPAVIAPGSAFTTRATGFASNNTIHISYNGQTEGAARHMIEGYFGELTKKTDGNGSALFSGLTGVYEGGATSFEFKDEAGNATTGTVTIRGKAQHPFLFGPQVEVTTDNIQIGITGVGWTPGKKKSVRGLDPNQQAYTPQQLVDLCQGAPCPEREDGLKLVIIIPRSTPSGANTLIVDEEGAEQVRAFVTIPELPENKKAEGREAEIFLIDPPAATVDVLQIYVRGSGWGLYDDRRAARAWLVDPDTEAFHELHVGANYRDCSFIKGDKLSGACLLESDELFLRLEIPENIKPALTPKKYLLFIQTEKNVRSGGAFTVLAKPTINLKKGTSIAIVPDRGPAGASTLLFGAGFPKKQFIDVRFDGVYVKLGGALWPNDDGTFENIPLQIPRTILRNGKETKVEAGTHTISLSAKDAGATTAFVVEEPTDKKKKKEEEARLKKEQEERDRIEKEQKKLKEEQDKIKKEEERLEKERNKLEEELKKKKEEEQKEKDKEDKERLLKERKKLEEELKKKKEEEQKKEKQLKETKDKKEKLDDRFCDAALPLTFQPGCVQKKTTPQKSEYEGKPCRADMAITFQPGCVGQKPDEQKQLFVGKPCTSDLPITFQPGCVSQTRADSAKPFTGKACDPSLPRVWQEGCIDEKEKQKEQKPTVQYYTPDSTGKTCKEGVAITFQPGCIPQTKTETSKPFMGKQCDSKLPLVWQEGCIDSSGKTTPVQQQTQSQVQACNPLVPTYVQPGCKKE